MKTINYGRRLALAAVLMGLQSNAFSALEAFYAQTGNMTGEMLNSLLVRLQVLMPLQEVESASLTELNNAREANKNEMEQFRSHRTLMEDQLAYFMQRMQSQQQQIDPAQLMSMSVTQKASILCSSFAAPETELAQPVITPAQFVAAVTRHAETLVQALQAQWKARNIEYRNEKERTAGFLANITAIVIESTVQAATTLWFAHNISLEQFETMLSEQRSRICSIIAPLSETIQCVMKQ